MRIKLPYLAIGLSACAYLGCTSQVSRASSYHKKAQPPYSSTAIHKVDDACAEQFWQGKRPKIVTKSLADKSRYLCFRGFALLYSGVSKTPLWVAEHLTKARMDAVRNMHRVDSFHEELRIPKSERAYLNDYNRYIFDRGHMAPNGDMANPDQQFDSFSLANIIPQSPWNNREVWRNLEEATRVLAVKEQDVYVMTGGAFLSDKIQKMGRILVPTHVFKVLYFPTRNVAGVYFAPNDESKQVQVISLYALEQQIGINLMPQLTSAEKQRRVTLPYNAKSAKRFTLYTVEDGAPSPIATSPAKP